MLFLLDWRTFLCVRIVLLKDYIRLTVLTISWIAIQVVELNARPKECIPQKENRPTQKADLFWGAEKNHSFLHGLPGEVAEINVRKPKDRSPFFSRYAERIKLWKNNPPKMFCVYFQKSFVYCIYIYTVYVYIYINIYYISIPILLCFFSPFNIIPTSTLSTQGTCRSFYPEALPPSWALPAWHIWPRPGSSNKPGNLSMEWND